MIRLVPSLLFALLLTACSSPPTAASSLVGHWEPTSAELGGASFPVAKFGGGTLQLTADGYDFAGDKGTYAVDSTKKPAAMDIHGKQGPNAGRWIQAIFELKGEQLTICYQLGSGARPTEFKSPKGSDVLLVHYKYLP